MKNRKLTHTIISSLLGIAAGWGVATATALTFKESSTVRSVAAIAAVVGVATFATSRGILTKDDISAKDVDKAVLNALRLKLSDTNISATESSNLTEVVAMYASTVESQSTDHETTLYQLLN